MHVLEAAMINQLAAPARQAEVTAGMEVGVRAIARLGAAFGAVALFVLALDAAAPDATAGPSAFQDAAGR